MNDKPDPLEFGFFWCFTHKRPANHLSEIGKLNGKPNLQRTCDPSLGGIMIPCSVSYVPGLFTREQPQPKIEASDS